MAEKVTYHQESGENREFVILAENPDGTFDVGPEGGPVVVAKCELSSEPKFGAITLGAPSPDAVEHGEEIPAEPAEPAEPEQDEKSTKKNSKK